jgi:hypothetical protein
MKQLDTHYLLTQWGIWLRYGDGIPRYVSPHFALIRDNIEQHSSAPVACISEDLCMMIDGIVARLRQRNAEMGHALVVYYGRDVSYAGLAKGMGISKTRAESLVKSAEQWVDGVLDEKVAA